MECGGTTPPVAGAGCFGLVTGQNCTENGESPSMTSASCSDVSNGTIDGNWSYNTVNCFGSCSCTLSCTYLCP